MNTLTINAALIRGAQAAQAIKDRRYCLCGILLASNGAVVGTDGKVLFKGVQADDSVPPEHDIIVSIKGKIPVSAETCTFTFTDDNSGTVTTDTGKAFTFTVVDGEYPDYPRVIPDKNRDAYANGFGVNATLLAKAATAFGKNAHVNLYHGTENDPVLIEYAGSNSALTGALFVVMPLRTDGDFIPLFEHAKKD